MTQSTASIEASISLRGPPPTDNGTVKVICIRPALGERTTVSEASFTRADGLVGDNWRSRGSKNTADGASDPNAQIAIISSRVMESVEPDPYRALLAGDQLHMDLDLSTRNLSPGDRLHIGTAVFEITPKPHTGCAKFQTRFGKEAREYCAAEPEERRRGIYAKVVQDGTVRCCDVIRVERRSPRRRDTATLVVIAFGVATLIVCLLRYRNRK